MRRGARAPLAILRLIEDAARGWQQYGLQARGHTRPGRRAASFRATTALSLATWLAGLPLGAAAQTPSVTVTGDVSPLPSPNPLPHWTPGGLLDIGQTGTGALTIAGGGTVSMGSEDVRLGKEVGGIGSVSVTGTGSSLSGSGQLDVGHNGTGSLLIEAGGTVSFDFVTIGNAGGPSHRAAGSVTVKGAGSSLSSGGMYVGAFGDGTLTIQDGGTVSVGSGGGTVWVASYGTHGGTGTVNIGAASGQPAAAVGSLLAAEVAFGAGTGRIVFNHTSTAYTFAPKITGAGALLIEAGVTILTGTNTYSGGTTINGGVLSISRDANLGAVSGGLTLNGGALRTTSSFTSARDVTLSAAGGTIDASGVLTLSGQISGPGSLLVNGPGTLSLTGAHNVIGGAFTLSGSASPTLEIKGGSLTVGDPTGWAMGWNEVSNGLLRVSNGGTLKLVDPMGYLAIKSAMEVSGANSSVTNEGYTDVGGPAAATLTISSGGVMNSKAGALIEGHGTSATVSVTGAGSVWNVEQHMFIGSKWSNGTGALVVSDGGIVNLNGSLYYDSDAGLGLASATVTVTGAGSQLNVVDGLFVGYGCGCGATTAMLTAADGGTVKAGWVEISDTSVLNLGTGGRAGTIDTHAILNDGAIVADFVDTATLAANISGTGTLTKQGTGQLILTGSNSYTGATSVLSGLLTVNGSLTGSTITLAGGALGGSGTVGSVVVGHAGTVAPGNSIGTLNVAGNISFASGSTYQLEVNAAGQSDRIAATGTATLSGGTVQLLAEQGGYGASTRYTILTAQGGVIGQFAAVASNFAFLTPSLAYGANDVALTLDRNAIAFPQVALTRNQAGAAGAAEALGAGNRVYDALLTASVADARAGFDALSGEIHAQAVGVAIEDSHLIRESILNRLRWPLAGGTSGGTVEGAFSADAPGRSGGTTLPAPRLARERFTLWGEAIGAQGRTDGDRNAASLDRRGGGMLFGAELNSGWSGDGHWRLGLAGGYTHTDFDIDGRRSSGELGSAHGALYGGMRFGAVSLRAGAAYAWSDLDVTRRVALPGISDLLRLDGRSATAQAFAEIGYALPYGPVSFEPFAQIAAVTVRTSRDAETGGPTALQVLGRDQRLGFSTLGLRAEMQLGATPLLARGMLGWRHAFGDTTPAAKLAFIGAATPFQTFAAPLARNALVAEAGLAWRATATTTLGVSYGAAISDNARDHALKGRIDVRF